MENLFNKIQRYIIDIQSNLLDALSLMDKIDCKLLLVFENGEYTNLLSIGDVQRCILKYGKTDVKLHNALRTNVRVGYSNESLEMHKRLILKYRIAFLPILSEEGKLVDVIFWDELIKEEFTKMKNQDFKNIPLVIMAGGKGTRLEPITHIIPKPLIPLGKKPIIESIIDSFVDYGINEVIVSVNYKADLIKYYFNTIEDKEYTLDYVNEDKPLGTAGSLKLLEGKVKGTFVVSNCDIFIKDDYSEILKYHKQQGCALTAVAVVKSFDIPYGTMEIGNQGMLLTLKEKPSYSYYVNSGLYILESEVLTEIPKDQFYHITELMQQLMDKGKKVGVFPVSEKSWLDIGNWQEYQKSQILFNS